jgi:hypothetical protein
MSEKDLKRERFAVYDIDVPELVSVYGILAYARHAARARRPIFRIWDFLETPFKGMLGEMQYHQANLEPVAPPTPEQQQPPVKMYTINRNMPVVALRQFPTKPMVVLSQSAAAPPQLPESKEQTPVPRNTYTVAQTIASLQQSVSPTRQPGAMLPTYSRGPVPSFLTVRENILS